MATTRPSSTISIQEALDRQSSLNVPPTSRSPYSREFLTETTYDVDADAARETVEKILGADSHPIDIKDETIPFMNPIFQATGAGVSSSGLPTPLPSSPTQSARLFENENNWTWLKRISSQYFFSPLASSIQAGWQFSKDHPGWLVLAFLTTLPGGVNAFCMAANTDPKDFLKTIPTLHYDTLMFATFNAICSTGVNWDMNARFLPDAWVKLKNSMRTFFKDCSHVMSNSLALSIGVAALTSAFAIAYDAWSFLPAGLITALIPAILNSIFNFATRYLGAFNIFNEITGTFNESKQMTKECIEILQSLKQNYINKLEQELADSITKDEINGTDIDDIFLTLNKWTESPIMCALDQHLLKQFLVHNNVESLQAEIEKILLAYEDPEKCTAINAQIRAYIDRQTENQTPDFNQLLCIIYHNTKNDFILDQIREYLLRHSVTEQLTTTNIRPFIDKVDSIIANKNVYLPEAERMPLIKQASNQFINENRCHDLTLDSNTLCELFAKIDELTRRPLCKPKTWPEYGKSFLITLFDVAVGLTSAASIGLLFDAKGSAGANIMSHHREQTLPTSARIAIGVFPAIANALFYVDHVMGFSEVARKTFAYLIKNPQYWINFSIMTGATLFSASSMQNIMYSILAHYGKDKPLNSTNFFDIHPDSPLGQSLIWSVAAFAFMVNWKVLANNYYASRITENAPLHEHAIHHLNKHPLTEKQAEAYSNHVLFNHQKATRKPEPEPTQSMNPDSPIVTPPSGF